MAIADDFAAIAAGMRRNAWKARKLVYFRCDALWCTNKPMPLRLRHLACYATRIVTGIPRHVIRLTTLHAIFASVR